MRLLTGQEAAQVPDGSIVIHCDGFRYKRDKTRGSGWEHLESGPRFYPDSPVRTYKIEYLHITNICRIGQI